jgi:anti-sigma regulatory factor (Ser/Thr protein kinase)
VSDERRFSHTPASVAQARHFVLGAVSNVPAESREMIAVMVSELATNALRHAETSFSIRVDQARGTVRVEVSDGGEGRPAVRSPEPSEPSGRGLRIVESLSDAWGVTAASGAGKTVWFTLAVPNAEPERLQESG